MSVYFKSQGIDHRVAIGVVVDPGTGSYTKLEILKVFELFEKQYDKVIKDKDHDIIRSLYVMVAAYIDDF